MPVREPINLAMPWVPHLGTVIAVPPATQLQFSRKEKHGHIVGHLESGWEAVSREDQGGIL